MWPEIKDVKEENRYELTLTGDTVKKYLEDADGELDPNIYDLSQLNLLRINNLPLESISEKIIQIENLANLILVGNKLKKLPDAIGSLQKLKFLDVSRNCIECIPESIGKLENLMTLNVSINSITELPGFESCVNLAHLDARDNSITEFPDICHESLGFLADVHMGNNKISEIPLNITVLPSLKILDLPGNSIKIIPGELIDCSKLKELHLKGNPLTDRRFRKLVESDRCLPRQVMDYIKQHCPKTTQGSKGGGKGKKGKKGGAVESDPFELLYNKNKVQFIKIEILVLIVALHKEIDIYYAFCLAKGILYRGGPNLFKFRATGTKLHEGICEKRLAATIATHDLSKLKSPLRMVAKEPKTIRIHPLSRGKEISAKELYLSLQKEVEEQRKQQKRNTSSGIHRFLHLLQNWSMWPCFVDADGVVISLPPITNSDTTKISPETENVFVEVTSSTSLAKAKEAMDALVMVALPLSAHTNENGHAVLSVQQVRVEDDEAGLKVLYPSRTDLTNDKILIVRGEK
ncbi:unnamed protein product, partial [Meganyctiphanes norvegica]